MEIRIPRVLLGTNEEVVPMYGPASDTPPNYTACEITETEYVYQVPDVTDPEQDNVAD